MWSKLDEKQPIVFLRNLLKGAKARATTHTGVQVVHCTNVYTKEKWGWNLAHGLLPNYISWNRATKRMGNLFYSILFLFGGATPSACRSFQERDHTHTTGATQATGVTMPDPQPVVPQENSYFAHFKNYLPFLSLSCKSQNVFLGCYFLKQTFS